MTPTRTFATLAILAALTACSDPQPPATIDSTSAAAETPSVPGAEPPEADGPEPDVAPASPFLPSGVGLSIAAEQRSMHEYTTQAGLERRVVIFEFLEGDLASTARALEQDLVSAGFQARHEEDRGDGKTRISFTKTDYGRVNATLTDDLGNAPANPEAKGVFSLDIPLGPEDDSSP